MASAVSAAGTRNRRGDAALLQRAASGAQNIIGNETVPAQSGPALTNGEPAMRTIVVIFLAAAALTGAVLQAPAPAVAAEGDKVVVKVNGAEIRASDIKYAAQDLVAQLTGVPGDQRYRFLVEYMVERYLLMQAAEKAKIAETDAFKQRMRYYAGKALRDAYFETNIEPQVTDDEAKKIYEKEVADIKPEDEVRVRHIFVRTEKEAKEIHALLSQGHDFAELAKKRSISPAALQGGDLGYFTKDSADPAIAEVAFKLKKGQVSQPFKVKFGWQIVKVEDRRKRELQSFDKVKLGIRSLLLRSKVAEKVGALRKSAKIDYLDPDAKPKEPKTAQGKKDGAKKQ